ncbi:unnamed protein product [Gongylonema pulchrum]|uniref:Thioesterase n=1 Tax=Gongylonema pulchrum TaxID=637853 RepID=A0A183DBL8_9BILA|nr:unnamed protein product [Gongylonema pulchrum]
MSEDYIQYEEKVDFGAHLNYETPLARFLAMASNICRKNLAHCGRQFSYCDEVAVGIVINPQIITECKFLKASVELNGSSTRGQVVCDWTDHHTAVSGVTHSTKAPSEKRASKMIKFVVSYDAVTLNKLVCDAVKKSEQTLPSAPVPV